MCLEGVCASAFAGVNGIRSPGNVQASAYHERKVQVNENKRNRVHAFECSCWWWHGEVGVGEKP